MKNLLKYLYLGLTFRLNPIDTIIVYTWVFALVISIRIFYTLYYLAKAVI